MEREGLTPEQTMALYWEVGDDPENLIRVVGEEESDEVAVFHRSVSWTTEPVFTGPTHEAVEWLRQRLKPVQHTLTFDNPPYPLNQ